MQEEQNEDFVLKFQIMYDGSRVPIVYYFVSLSWRILELASVWRSQIVIVIILGSLKFSEVADIIVLVTLLKFIDGRTLSRKRY